MKRPFKGLSDEKQKLILEVCIDEFSTHGYMNASTNRIVKNAGISKGSLFNYFGTKKELFLYIVDHSIEQFSRLSVSETPVQSDDLFERLKERGLRKLKTAIKYPRLYSILYNAFIELDESMKNEVMSRMGNASEDASETLKEGLDLSKFKPGVDVDVVIDIVQMFLEGYFHRMQKTLGSMNAENSLEEFDHMFRDCDLYLLELQKAFYN